RSRAGILAEAAEHAAAQVVGEVGQFLAARVGVALATYHNQVLGTGQRTQVARNAQRFVGIGIVVEAGRAAEPLGDLRSLQRILLGDGFLRILVAKGDLQAL